MSKQFTLGNLLSAILSSADETEDEEDEEGLTCSNCGMTYKEFLQTGMFGCPKCYQSFGKPVEDCIRKIQGSVKHTGKVPQGFETEAEAIIHSMSEVERLSIRLQQAVEKEEFEEAAKLRDQIRAIKNEGTKELKDEGTKELKN